MDNMDCRVDMNDLPKLLEVNNAVTKLISEGKDFGYFKDTYGMNSVEFDMCYFMRMNKLTGDEVVEVIKIACANFISPRTAMRLQETGKKLSSWDVNELLILHKIVHKDVMEYIKSKLKKQKSDMDILLGPASGMSQDFWEAYIVYSVAKDKHIDLIEERSKIYEHREVDSTEYQWLDVQWFVIPQKTNWKELSLFMINEQIQVYSEIISGARNSEISDIIDAVVGVVDQRMDSNEALSEQDCPRASRKRTLDDVLIGDIKSEALLSETKREPYGKPNMQFEEDVNSLGTITGVEPNTVCSAFSFGANS